MINGRADRNEALTTHPPDNKMILNKCIEQQNQKPDLLGASGHYILELAKRVPDPNSIELLAELILDTPQFTIQIEEKDKPLSFDEISKQHEEKINRAKQLSQEKGSISPQLTGKQIRKKVIGVLEKLSHTLASRKDKDPTTAIASLSFEKLSKQKAIPSSLYEKGGEFWWETVIPNILLAHDLHTLALRKGSSLATNPELRKKWAPLANIFHPNSKDITN